MLSSGGASQPAGRRTLSSGGASQPAGSKASTVNVQVGCFNIGISQEMLSVDKHIKNFKRILGKAFDEGDMHLLGLCEVGGHKKGLKTEGIHPQDLIDGVLNEKEYGAEAIQAYMSVWHAVGAAQPNGVSLQLAESPTSVKLTSPALDPQLVICDFRVTAHGHDGKVGRLVQGLLHIRTPTGQNALSEATKNG